MKSTFKWKENFQSVVNDNRDHTVNLDLPSDKGGNDTGTTALELCAMSLNGCIGTIFAMMAAKIRLTYTQLDIELEAERGADDATFTAVRYLMRIKTDAPREKVEKCLSYTVETCPVGVLFHQAGVKIEGKVEML